MNGVEVRLNPIKSFKSFWADAKHVLSVSYRPDIDTFRRTLKVVIIGVLVLGVLGFIVYEIINLI